MGKRHEEMQKLIDQDKTYPIDEAIELLIKTKVAKFDASVEVHFQLGIDPKKGEQQLRGTISLPHGSGKATKIVAFTDKVDEAKAAGADAAGGKELIDEIKKSGKCEFDVAVAEPAMMKNLAPLARILGPRGLMPSPKSETVTTNISETIAQIKKGKISYKNDDTANLHVMIAKISFSPEQIKENLEALIAAIKKAKPTSSKGIYIKGISINSTMSPGIRLQA